jgi:nucleoside 2-deoxyribosyltransferase
MGSPSSTVEVQPSLDWPLFYLRSQSDLAYYLQQLVRLGHLEEVGERRVRLTLAGWRHLEALELNRSKSAQAFVAMAFSSDMDSVWEEGIRPALEDAGYDPLRMDQLEHNDRVDDRIIAEIRRSSLVVADFTRHRAGVYFEAGFALGLGLPVIWLCRKDELEEAHFDTRQYSHIAWEEPQDLRIALTNRVLATTPRQHSDDYD